MRKISTPLIYLSIIFLIFYLFKIDYINFNEVTFNFIKLGIAILFLGFGFFVSCLSWRKSLKTYNYSISIKESVISHGLPIFSKYIPGKLWTIIGRAGLVSQYITIRTKEASYISLKEQLIFIFTALLITAWLPLKVLDNIYVLVYLVGIVVLFLFLFNRKTNQLFLSLLKRFKLNLDIPYMNIKKLAVVFLYCLLYWALWMAGYYFLIASVTPGSVDCKVAFVFPFSAIIGLLAIFVPGGVGVREGIMVIALVHLGFSKEIAISISLISRLWFLFGEIFIFLASLWLRHSNKNIPQENIDNH